MHAQQDLVSAILLTCVSCCSPDNRTGTADYVQGWVDIAENAGAEVVSAPTPYLDVRLACVVGHMLQTSSCCTQQPGACR